MSTIPDGYEMWAMVELWRWQFGMLPHEQEEDDVGLALDVPVAIEAMANAIQKGDADNFPKPVNVVAVLRYAAKLIRATDTTSISEGEL